MPRRPIAIVTELVRSTGAEEVVKVKSLTTDEIRLSDALGAAGIAAVETDLAELINQLAGDSPSHILVPAIHRNRAEIREVFRRELPGTEDLSDDPAALAEAARRFLRGRFLSARVAISGANFAVAQTGTVCVVESEGNGRMCTTLPQTLITVMGIEKVLPRFADLEVMLQLLPRSSTAERMNPYTSLWTGVTPGDGPQEFHLVLLDAGRTSVTGRSGRTPGASLHPLLGVSERLSGVRAHGRPRLRLDLPGADRRDPHSPAGRAREGKTLPWASSLCGACYDACPVKIDIPTVLVHLRGRITRESRAARHARRARVDASAGSDPGQPPPL